MNGFKITTSLTMAALLAFQSSINGQRSEDSGEDVVTLSPYAIEEDANIGYLATTTLAGSRLNTALRDIPATVHVFTPEFLEDIGAMDLEDVLLYSTNTIKNADEEDFFSGAFDVRAELSFRALVRGLPATRARNFFRWQLPTDTYNTERLAESRGPNGILFGIGGPGGVVNQSTKRARLSADTYRAQVKLGKNSLNRFSVDINKVLVEDKLALRINALYHDENGWRTYDRETKKAQHAALVFRPFENTTLHVAYENYERNDSVSRNVTTSLYTAKAWETAGRPTLDIVNMGAPPNPDLFAQGMQRHSGNMRVTMFDQEAGSIAGQVKDLRQSLYTRNRDSNGRGGFIVNDFVYPQALFPTDVSLEGPGQQRWLDYEDIMVQLDQKLAEGLFLHLGWNKTDSFWDALEGRGSTPGGPFGSIMGDPNEFFRDGTANPYAGGYFVDYAARRPINAKDIETRRIALSYEWNFSDWSDGWLANLGRHRFATSFEDYTEDADGRVESEVWLDAASGAPAYFTARPDHIRNRAWRRHYVNDENNFEDYHAPDFGVQYGRENAIPDPNDPSRMIYTDFVMDLRTPADLVHELESTMIALQSYFWDNRIVTTLGYRREEGNTTKFNYELNDIGNEYVPIGPNDVIFNEYTGDTKSLGGVFHANDWLSFTYNTASNVDIPDNDARVIPGTFPDAGEGEGEDFGVIFNLLDGRMVVRALRYETSQRKITSSLGIPAQVYNRSERILDGLFDQGFITEAEAAAHRLGDRVNRLYLDKDSVGYEFTVTANVTDNWSFNLNYSKTEKEQSNVGNAVKVWATEESAFWVQSLDGMDPNTVFVEDGGDTIQQEIEDLDFWISDRLRPGATKGLRPHKFNVFTNYNFRDGFMKGFSVGGGYRWLSENLMGWLNSNGRNIWGEAYGTADLMFRYRTKLSDKYNLSVQLNIQNVLDEDEYLPGAYNGNDPNRGLRNIYLREPIDYQLTTTISF